MLLFFKQVREVMNGNLNSIGNCAGGKPPVQTGQPPAPADLTKLMVGVLTTSKEMIERFTLWIEKRL
jgi:hypothetical protein